MSNWENFYNIHWEGFRTALLSPNRCRGTWIAQPKEEYRHRLPMLITYKEIAESYDTIRFSVLEFEKHVCKMTLEGFMTFSLKVMHSSVDTTDKSVKWWNKFFDLERDAKGFVQ